jgi:hypothetical protein
VLGAGTVVEAEPLVDRELAAADEPVGALERVVVPDGVARVVADDAVMDRVGAVEDRLAEREEDEGAGALLELPLREPMLLAPFVASLAGRTEK